MNLFLTDPKSVDADISEEIVQNVSQVDNSSVSIIIPPEVFNSSVLRDEEEIAMVFAEYDSSILYPLPSNSILFTDENVTYTNFSVASTLLTATIVGHENDIVDLDTDITLVLKLESKVLNAITIAILLCLSNFVVFQRSQLPLCVFWNKTAAGIMNLVLSKSHQIHTNKPVIA